MALVVVAFTASIPAQRSEVDPRYSALSMTGRKLDVIPLVRARYVDVVFVPVALVQMRPVKVPLDETMLVIVPFVANKFVVVAFVDVTFPKTPLYLSEFDPRDTPRSEDGVMNPPDADKMRSPSFFVINPLPKIVDPVPTTKAPFV
mgnify:CR=1 FL=1